MQNPILTQNKMPWQSDEWQKLLSSSTRTLDELIDRLSFDESGRVGALQANEIFRARAPDGFLERIQRHSKDDPLLKQILPDSLELNDYSGFVKDPLEESESSPVPGLLHKYHGRALIVLTSACAIHCRYCFRRHFPYKENRLSGSQWDELVDHIRKDNTIEEIILSGGDPLSLKTEQLKDKLTPLLETPHLRRLRIHSRMPVVIPERIDQKLLEWLDEIDQHIIMVVHANHRNELGDRFGYAMSALHARKVMLLNQSVLLKGVNDDPDTLVNLSHRLFEYQVMPYYLHLLDKVAGAGHFEVSEDNAKKIYTEILSKMPGYLVPKLVRDSPGAKFKMPLS